MRCNICGKEFYGYGNNPYPLCEKDNYKSRCCDTCDKMFVVPARLDMMVNELTIEEVQAKYNYKGDK